MDVENGYSRYREWIQTDFKGSERVSPERKTEYRMPS
jgi:hypothetical protein